MSLNSWWRRYLKKRQEKDMLREARVFFFRAPLAQLRPHTDNEFTERGNWCFRIVEVEKGGTRSMLIYRTDTKEHITTFTENIDLPF